MADLKKVINGIECCLEGLNDLCQYEDSDAPGGCRDELLLDALVLLKAQEPDYPVCERCGKQIDHVKINVFNYDGSDSEYCIPLHFDKPHGCVSFETSQNWTGYSLTDEEQKEDIRCPHCGKYPFNRSVEIEFYEPVEVLMWTSTDEQMEKVKLDG